jgi:prophage regulatory protein
VAIGGLLGCNAASKRPFFIPKLGRLMTVKKSQDQIPLGVIGGMRLRIQRMLRLTELQREKWPRSKTTIYADIADGVFPPPVALGERCSAWVEGEVDAVRAARVAGASKAEIRELVKQLMAARRGPQ